jgi:hypothetical protein
MRARNEHGVQIVIDKKYKLYNSTQRTRGGERRKETIACIHSPPNSSAGTPAAGTARVIGESARGIFRSGTNIERFKPKRERIEHSV